MASELDTLVSTGATLAVGSNIMFDSVTIGASTGKVEVIKIADGTAGSTTLVPMSSNGIGAAGLNTFVTNSTANPIGVSLAGGQSSVTVSGAVPVTDNAGSLTIDFNNAAISSANPIPMVLVSTSATPGNVMISSAAPASTDLGLAVRQVGFVAYSTNVTAAALTTASKVQVELSTTLMGGSSNNPVHAFVDNQASVTIASLPNVTLNALTTGSKIQVELTTTLMGGSSASPVWVVNIPQIGTGASTFANPTKMTTTAVTVLFSSAASTRWNITDLTVTNKGATATLFRIFDGATNATVLYQVWCASAGGGAAPTFPVPRSGSSGSSVSAKILPASTVYVSAGAFRSA